MVTKRFNPITIIIINGIPYVTNYFIRYIDNTNTMPREEETILSRGFFLLYFHADTYVICADATFVFFQQDSSFLLFALSRTSDFKKFCKTRRIFFVFLRGKAVYIAEWNLSTKITFARVARGIEAILQRENIELKQIATIMIATTTMATRMDYDSRDDGSKKNDGDDNGSNDNENS